MKNVLLANAQIEINKPLAKVWQALVTTDQIKQYMFGTNVVSDWKEGAPIVWQGEWKGKPYADKGVILKLQPEHTLQYSHFSPLSGQPDVPENYHVVTIDLAPAGAGTLVKLSQNNNATEKDQAESKQTWDMMLAGLKKFLEG